jgi:hypothetical protein
MNVPPAVVTDLTLLSAAIDEPESDLPAIVGVLSKSLADAIPSYLGMTLTLQINTVAVSVDTMEPEAALLVRASLKMALLPLFGSTATGSVAFYSRRAGTLSDLADNVTWVFNLDGRPVLDGGDLS